MKYLPVVYSSYHISETLQILLFTGLGFFLLIKKLTPEPTISLDMDWFYRMGGRAFQWVAKKPVQAVDTAKALKPIWTEKPETASRRARPHRGRAKLGESARPSARREPSTMAGPPRSTASFEQLVPDVAV